MSLDRRAFIQALAALAVPGIATAAPSGQLVLATYPGTGKADIGAAEFMAGVLPLRADLERASGMSLAISLLRPIRRFNAAAQLALKAPDLAYGPATSVAAYMAAGYRPLARNGEPASGVIASKLPLRAIRSVAFPDPDSWLALVGEYTVEALTGRGLEYQYARSQNAAIEAMRYGLADAVALRPEALAASRLTESGYRIIARMPDTPDYTVLIHPRLDVFTRAALKAALLGLPAATLAALDRVYHVRVGRFVRAEAGEYDLLRRIVAAAKSFG